MHVCVRVRVYCVYCVCVRCVSRQESVRSPFSIERVAHSLAHRQAPAQMPVSSSAQRHPTRQIRQTLRTQRPWLWEVMMLGHSHSQQGQHLGGQPTALATARGAAPAAPVLGSAPATTSGADLPASGPRVEGRPVQADLE